MCRGVWNPPFLFLLLPLYQTTLFTKTNIPTLLQIMFFKNKHDANLHNSFEYNHISYYSLIAFDKRVTFWLQHVRSLPCTYVALFACRPARITITQSHIHTMQQRHTYKAVTGRVEAKKLLSRQRQSEYSKSYGGIKLVWIWRIST